MTHNLAPLLRHASAFLKQHRLRSVLSTLGIACGVISFLIMMSVGEGAKRETLAQIEQLGMKNTLIKAATLSPGQKLKTTQLGSQGLSMSDAGHLKQGVRGVNRVEALRELKLTVGSSKSGTSPQVLAMTSGFLNVQGLALETGRFIVDSDSRDHRLVCVLGYQTAQEMGQDGRPDGMVRLEDSVYRVVGVLRPSARPTEKNAAISIRDLDHSIVLPLSSDEVTELIVEFRSSEDVLPAIPMLKRYMEVAHHGADDYQIVVPQELLRQVEQTRSTFDVLMGGIALISLLVGGIGIMNIMLANIAERTHEIGLRRALGATQLHILTQFLAEAVILTGIGGIIGVCLGLMGLWAGSMLAQWNVWVTPGAVMLPFFLSIVMGLLFGLYPAISAAELDPIVALNR